MQSQHEEALLKRRKGQTYEQIKLAKNIYIYFFNPLSPNSNQHQLSPNNIHTLSRD